jgi:hypothetical protein
MLGFFFGAIVSPRHGRLNAPLVVPVEYGRRLKKI